MPMRLSHLRFLFRWGHRIFGFGQASGRTLLQQGLRDCLPNDGNFASKMNRFHCLKPCKLKLIWNRINIILYCCLIGWNSSEVPFCPSFLKINIKLKSTVMNIILYYLHLVCELCHRTVILPLFHEFSRPSAWDLGGGHWPSKVNFPCIVNSDGAATPLSNLFLTMFKKDSTF